MPYSVVESTSVYTRVSEEAVTYREVQYEAWPTQRNKAGRITRPGHITVKIDEPGVHIFFHIYPGTLQKLVALLEFVEQQGEKG